MSKHTFKRLMEQKKAEFRREIERRGLRFITTAEKEREERKREKEKEDRERAQNRGRNHARRTNGNTGRVGQRGGNNRQHSGGGGRRS